MRTLKSLALFTLVGMMLGAVDPAAAALPDVLKAMPADSQVIIVSQSLTALSQKIDAFAKKAQLPLSQDPSQPFQLSQMLDEQLGLSNQIDASRGIGLSIQNLSMAGETLVAFIPMRNASEAIAQLQLEKAPNAEGIWVNQEDGVYLKPTSQYMLLADNVEMLNGLGQRAAGIALSAHESELLSRSDVAAIIQLSSVLELVRPMLTMQINQDEDLQKYPSVAKILTMGVDRLAEVDRVLVAGRISDAGFGLSIHGQAKAGSVLAKYLSGHPQTDLSPLASLPKGNFIMASVGRMDSKLFTEPLGAIMETLAADTSLPAKIDPQDVRQTLQLMGQMYEGMSSQGVGQALYASKQPAQGLKVLEVSSYANITESLEVLPKVLANVGKILAQAGIEIPMTFQKDAGKADGVSYHELRIDLSQLPVPPEVMQMLAMQWGGQPVITEQFAVFGDNLAAVGMGEGAIEEVVQLAKSAPKGLHTDPAIQSTAKHLPAQANGLVFLDVGKYLQFAFSSAMPAGGAQGMNPMMMMGQMFGNLKGMVGVGVTLEEGRMEMEMFVPTEIVQSAFATYMQIMMMMMQPPPGADTGSQGQSGTF
ncbi:MAG: hypothetical protein JW810_13195 [Sedimentisphaerales bacterium]|nr:hypothetical protein [Sedimentisphaerales bacterium]